MYSQDSFDHLDTGKKSRRRAFSRRIFNFYRENQAVFITAKKHFFRLRIAEFAQGNRYLVRTGIKLQPAAAAPPGQQQVTMPKTRFKQTQPPQIRIVGKNDISFLEPPRYMYVTFHLTESPWFSGKSQRCRCHIPRVLFRFVWLCRHNTAACQASPIWT